MNIDVHWHYVPETCIERLPGRPRDAMLPQLYSPELQVAEMDRRRLDMAAVSPSPQLFQYQMSPEEGAALHRIVNDGIAELVAAYPARFVGLAAVPLQNPSAATGELERMMERGFRGMEIGTNVAGRNLDDLAFRPVFKRAADLGAFVFVHPSNVLGADRLTRYHLGNLIGNPTDTSVAIASLIFGGVYDEVPSLTCCFAHGGGCFPILIGRWRHGHSVREEARMFGAKPPDQYLDRIYLDTLVHDDHICRYVIDTVGADHVMIGSDMPYDMGASDPVDRVERLQGLSEADKELIKGGNAARLLHLNRVAA